MKNFCLYNGKKIVKPETWNITSVELSSDYTSAIIQAESKSNKSEYTLDVTPLINNQYKSGLDVYSSTIVNELTGVSDWVLDSANNRVVYTEEYGGRDLSLYKDRCLLDVKAYMQNIGVNSSWALMTARVVYPSGNQNADYVECEAALYTGSQNTRMATYPITGSSGGEQYLPLEVVSQKVISNAEGGDSSAQQAIISAFNNITDGILTSDYSEFFEQNKQPK